jgi:radical SAM superfamily enzyme YgiQ (UPF0313 family)
VIAGGPTATHPEPVAPFFDAIVIGDGEEKRRAAARLWRALQGRGRAAGERLRALAKLGGVYVPALYETALDPRRAATWWPRARVPEAALPGARAFVDDLNKYPFPHDGPVAATETIFDRISWRSRAAAPRAAASARRG